mgnify:CR=1 FL=1
MILIKVLHAFFYQLILILIVHNHFHPININFHPNLKHPNVYDHIKSFLNYFPKKKTSKAS